MLTVDQARRLCLEPLEPLGSELVPLAAAAGRVLAEPVIARDAAPPFDASEMDGYAVRAADVAGAGPERPATLAVVAEVHAGEAPALPALAPGRAARIMTGAPLPPGADAVIPREWTRERGAEVDILRPSAGPGVFIRRAGDDYRPGDRLLEPGTRLSPGAIGLAASAGAARLAVHRRPRVALLATGDELLEPDRDLRPGAIRESNRLVLAALARAAGGEPEDIGIARDAPEDLEAKLRAALEAGDVVVSSGGVSVGERDLVRATLARCGVESRFWRVALKPGKPLAFGMLGPKPVFGLPGNPASSLVTFHLFVAPAIRRLSGLARVEPLALEAVLDEPASAPPDRRAYLRAVLRAAPSGLRVRPLPQQAAGAVRSLAAANALLVLPEGTGTLPAGARARVEPLDWPEPEAEA
jgi:molybdopterin molybdotransferase